jgi:peptide/nickel transport system substrate-binding protein
MNSVFDVRASRRQVIGGFLALGTVSALAACAGETSAGSGASGAGGGDAATKIVTAWPADFTTLDPVTAAGPQDWEMNFNVYERLVQPKFTSDGKGAVVWSGVDLQPQLAAFTLKGDTVTFTIRDGAKFYPSGNPVTTDDVLFTIKRLFDLGQWSTNVSGIQSMDQITKVDDRTLSMKMTDFDGKPITASLFDIQVFREPQFGIVDSVELKKHVTSADPTGTEWLKGNVIGSGPYYIKNRTPGQSIELAVVPGYPTPPAYKSVTIQITGGGSVLSLLKGGSVNLAVYGLTQNDVDSLASDKDAQVLYAKAPEFTLLELGSNAGPFKDQKVRQAVGYAIPYDEIVKSVYGGHAERQSSYVTKDAAGYKPSWEMYTTDIAKAKSLLAEAGNPKVSVPLHFLNSDPQLQDLATLIKSSAAAAGIEFVLTPETPAAFSALINNRAGKGEGSPDALLTKWGAWIVDASLPIKYYSTSNGVNNYPMWSDPRIDQIVKKNLFAEPGAARDTAFGQAQDIAAEGAAMFPIAQASRLVVLRKGMTAVSFSPEMGTRYWTISTSS